MTLRREDVKGGGAAALHERFTHSREPGSVDLPHGRHLRRLHEQERCQAYRSSTQRAP